MSSYSDDKADPSMDRQPNPACAMCIKSLQTVEQFQQVQFDKHSHNLPLDFIPSRLESTSLLENPSEVRCLRPLSHPAKCSYCGADAPQRSVVFPCSFNQSVIGGECVKTVEVLNCSVCEVYMEERDLEAHLTSDSHKQRMNKIRK